MSQRIIVIEKCDYCPYLEEVYGSGNAWGVCSKTNKFLKGFDFDTPDWCPLPAVTKEEDQSKNNRKE